MKTIQIKLLNLEESHTLIVNVPSIKKDFIQVSEIIGQEKFPILFLLDEDNIVTLLDLTGVTPYEIWKFDDKLEFYTRVFSFSSRRGNFRIQTQAKYLLFWHRESEVFKKFMRFECLEMKLGDD